MIFDDVQRYCDAYKVFPGLGAEGELISTALMHYYLTEQKRLTDLFKF